MFQRKNSRLYSAGLLSMILANFIQVGIAYRYFEGNETVDETAARGILVGATAVCVGSGLVAYLHVPKSHRRTFYEHLRFRRHVETFWWNEARHGLDANTTFDIDGVRAFLPVWLSAHYLPIERCKAFYAENWVRWEEGGSTMSFGRRFRGN